MKLFPAHALSLQATAETRPLLTFGWAAGQPDVGRCVAIEAGALRRVILPDMAVQATGAGQVQAQWVIDPMAVPVSANQFLVQASGDESGATTEVVLNFGYFNPPLVNMPGATQEQLEEAIAASVFPVPAVARVTMSRGRLVELHTKITEILAATGGEAGQ